MDSNKQQTSLEFFYEKVIDMFGTNKVLDIEFKKAKEMEKQQITDSYIEGCRKGFNEFGENSELYFTKK
jgi:1,2-phenylacetyl-CoA epoxidase catalytic subunit